MCLSTRRWSGISAPCRRPPSPSAAPWCRSPSRLAPPWPPAGPLYVLVDPGVVGHLGRLPLAAVAVGGTVMSVAVWFGPLMAYGTPGRAARRFGAGDRTAAVAEGVQASWQALATGALLVL